MNLATRDYGRPSYDWRESERGYGRDRDDRDDYRRDYDRRDDRRYRERDYYRNRRSYQDGSRSPERGSASPPRKRKSKKWDDQGTMGEAAAAANAAQMPPAQQQLLLAQLQALKHPSIETIRLSRSPSLRSLLPSLLSDPSAPSAPSAPIPSPPSAPIPSLRSHSLPPLPQLPPLPLLPPSMTLPLLGFFPLQAASNPALASNPMLALANMGPIQVAGRKQRELYVGNLLAGAITPEALKDFFTAALTSAIGYSPTMGPPVACVQMSGEGKFSFVEFRDEVMAVTALQLDKVELAHTSLHPPLCPTPYPPP